MASPATETTSDAGYKIPEFPISPSIASATIRCHGGLEAHRAQSVTCSPAARFKGKRKRKCDNEKKEEVNGQVQCEQYNIGGGFDSESEAATDAVSDFWKDNAASADSQGRGDVGIDDLSVTHEPEAEHFASHDPTPSDMRGNANDQAYADVRNIITNSNISVTSSSDGNPMRFLRMMSPDDPSPMGSRIPLTQQEMVEEAMSGSATAAAGMAMPAGKKAKSPSMPRLPPRPYHDETHLAKEWVGQLPLAMVAQLIPSKQVRSITRNDKNGKEITGWEAVKLE